MRPIRAAGNRPRTRRPRRRPVRRPRRRIVTPDIPRCPRCDQPERQASEWATWWRRFAAAEAEHYAADDDTPWDDSAAHDELLRWAPSVPETAPCPCQGTR